MIQYGRCTLPAETLNAFCTEVIVKAFRIEVDDLVRVPFGDARLTGVNRIGRNYKNGSRGGSVQTTLKLECGDPVGNRCNGKHIVDVSGVPVMPKARMQRLKSLKRRRPQEPRAIASHVHGVVRTIQPELAKSMQAATTPREVGDTCPVQKSHRASNRAHR